MTTVGDVLELAYGKALKAEDRAGGSVPVVGSGGIVGMHSVAITEDRTIVVGRKGSIGSVTWIDGPAWPIDTAYYVRAKEPDLDLRWTYWMLSSLPLASMNKSAAVPGLNRDDVYRLPVSVPSSAEQRRIAAILDRADAIRANRRASLTHLDELTNSLFEEMFGDPLGGDGDAKTRFLEDWIDPDRPITYGILKPGDDFEGGVPYVRVADMRDRGIALHALRRTSPSIAASYRRSTLRPGDLLMSIRGHVGRFAEVPAALDGANITQDAARIALIDPRARAYVRAAIEHPRAQAWMARRTKGAAVRGLNLGDLRQLPLREQPIEQVTRFSELMRRLASRRALSRESLSSDGELFASLQARAFRGGL